MKSAEAPAKVYSGSIEFLQGGAVLRARPCSCPRCHYVAGPRRVFGRYASRRCVPVDGGNGNHRARTGGVSGAGPLAPPRRPRACRPTRRTAGPPFCLVPSLGWRQKSRQTHPPDYL